jgi:Arc/MetJ family transcription regulator
VRTNIEIDDQLIARAMELTGLRTKRAVVDAALRELVEWRSRQTLREVSLGR